MADSKRTIAPLHGGATEVPHFAPAPHPAISAAPASPIQLDDLRVEILPGGYAAWSGTRAQLQAEGLIPCDIAWPEGDQPADWTEGPLHCRLMRMPPPGAKGRRSAYAGCDYWQLTRSATASLPEAWVAGRIHAAERALQQARAQLTREGEVELRRRIQADMDPTYQAFKAHLGLAKPHSRRVGA